MMAPLSTCNRRLIQQSLLRIDRIYTQRISKSLHGSTVRLLSSRHLFNSDRIHQRYHPSLAFRFHDSISNNSWISNPIQIPPAITTNTRYLSTKSTDSKNDQPTTKKPRKVTTLSISAKKRKNKKITMVTAYDYPSAVHVDRAGMDIVLVGDSCAMVELGFETTQVNVFCVFCAYDVHQFCNHLNSAYLGHSHSQKPITLDQMIHHCQAVKRGAPNRPLLIGDMPFGSYEFENVDIALQNAYRMVKEGGMDAVKFEVRY